MKKKLVDARGQQILEAKPVREKPKEEEDGSEEDEEKYKGKKIPGEITNPYQGNHQPYLLEVDQERKPSTAAAVRWRNTFLLQFCLNIPGCAAKRCSPLYINVKIGFNPFGLQKLEVKKKRKRRN